MRSIRHWRFHHEGVVALMAALLLLYLAGFYAALPLGLLVGLLGVELRSRRSGSFWSHASQTLLAYTGTVAITFLAGAGPILGLLALAGMAWTLLDRREFARILDVLRLPLPHH